MSDVDDLAKRAKAGDHEAIDELARLATCAKAEEPILEIGEVEIHGDDGDEDRLNRGERVFSNGHEYARCDRCGKVVKLTGWLGGMHLCA